MDHFFAKRISIFFIFVLQLLVLEVMAQRVRISPEFEVGTVTGQASFPDVAVDYTGDFVVAWDEMDESNLYNNVYARRFHANGDPKGDRLLVNTFTDGNQLETHVAMDSTGNFVIVWQSVQDADASFGVYAQRFDSAGTPLGAEFRVNDYATDGQMHADVAMNKFGDFVITWSSQEQDFSGGGIFAKRYAANGVAEGPEFQVNTYTNQNQWYPQIAISETKRFAITWQSDMGSWKVQARNFDSLGVAQGDEFTVSTASSGIQVEPSIAMDRTGAFTITFSCQLYPTENDIGVYSRRFDSTGQALGSDILALTNTSYNSAQSISMTESGESILIWTSQNADYDYNTWGKLYDSTGSAEQDDFLCNPHIKNTSYEAADVAMNPKTGDFVVASTKFINNGLSFAGIYLQLWGDSSRVRTDSIPPTPPKPPVVPRDSLSQGTETRPLSAFPNPATDEVTIKLTEATTVRIVDGMGSIVYEHYIQTSPVTIPIDHLLPGLYTVYSIQGSKIQKEQIMVGME